MNFWLSIQTLRRVGPYGNARLFTLRVFPALYISSTCALLGCGVCYDLNIRVGWLFYTPRNALCLAALWLLMTDWVTAVDGTFDLHLTLHGGLAIVIVASLLLRVVYVQC